MSESFHKTNWIGSRGIFRTQSNIYDKTFRKRNFIVDIQLGFECASGYTASKLLFFLFFSFLLIISLANTSPLIIS